MLTQTIVRVILWIRTNVWEMIIMSSAENNPIYYIEEDRQKSTNSTYRSKNQALLNKATQRNWNHKKAVRNGIILVLILMAISCFALIRAYASSHVQLNNEISSSEISFESKASVQAITIDIEKGDTLWSIANEYAPHNVSIQSYIHKIMKINGLKKPNIQEGHILTLPQI
jgi:LysM repeat protein